MIEFQDVAHGYGGGAEVAGGANAWVFGAGFVAATSLIHALGALSALAVMRMKAVRT